MAVNQKGLSGIRILSEQLHSVGPGSGNHLADWKSVVRVKNSGSEKLGKGLRSESASQGIPTGDNTRHGHAVNAALRHRHVAFRSQVSRAQAGGRIPAGVQAVHLARAGLIIDDEQIAANAVAGRFHQADGGIGRDCGIHGSSTPLQLQSAGAGRQWLACGDNTVICRHHRAADDRPALGSRVL